MRPNVRGWGATVKAADAMSFRDRSIKRMQILLRIVKNRDPMWTYQRLDPLPGRCPRRLSGEARIVYGGVRPSRNRSAADRRMQEYDGGG